MPVTYSLIASNTLASAAASVTFSAIPNTFTDLVLRYSNRYDTAANYNDFALALNGTTSTYSGTVIAGYSGTLTFSTRDTGNTYIGRQYVAGANITANTFASGEIYIPNYTSSLAKPTSSFSVVENNSSTVNIVAAAAGLWSGTSAVTSIVLSTLSGSFISGSSFFLYGIKNS